MSAINQVCVATLGHRQGVSAGFHVLHGKPAAGGSGGGISLGLLRFPARKHDIRLLNRLASDRVDDTPLDRAALLFRRCLAFRRRALLRDHHSGRQEQRSHPGCTHTSLASLSYLPALFGGASETEVTFNCAFSRLPSRMVTACPWLSYGFRNSGS